MFIVVPMILIKVLYSTGGASITKWVILPFVILMLILLVINIVKGSGYASSLEAKVDLLGDAFILAITFLLLGIMISLPLFAKEVDDVFYALRTYTLIVTAISSIEIAASIWVIVNNMFKTDHSSISPGSWGPLLSLSTLMFLGIKSWIREKGNPINPIQVMGFFIS